MPTYIGTEIASSNHDTFHPMEWGCRESDGLFGVTSHPSLDTIYLKNHNDLVGETWRDHNDEFSNFVYKNMVGDVLEIGSGNGVLSKTVFNKAKGNLAWHSIEPNPLSENISGFHIDGWFPHDVPETLKFNTIVNSHVVEHQPSPIDFVSAKAGMLSDGGRLIMSWPNMRSMATSLDLNFLMFEHLTYLPEEELIAICEHMGFVLVDKRHFGDHSIFVAFELVRDQTNDSYESLVSEEEFAGIANEYLIYLDSFSKEANSFFKETPNENFIFGAHVFAQYLIFNGLDTNNIRAILDNNKSKVGQRLYGTELSVMSPEELSTSIPVDILLPMGSYEDEVLSQLKDMLAPGSRILGHRVGLHVL